ncbi:MAG TPA: non-homologous end-joining DNA ligase [Longimicrobiales bacterium]|nr:non-homologous end-joining DNA ligase [Longimicrobiales bacterium]
MPPFLAFELHILGLVATKSSVKKQLSTYRKKRDFAITPEPSGDEKVKPAKKSKLVFVLQKHAASHLHFDLRLEVDGVMKSWAVPKGPSMDPSVKRLAMEVEDHPMGYNKFEGIIPQGEYGGGTVMLWDRGTYSADKAVNGKHEQAMREGHEKGKIDFTFHGERVKGSFALVRTRRGPKAQWLLIKHRDEYAEPGSDVVAENMTSVTTGRTMDEIGGGKSKVWHSNRTQKKKTTPPAKRAKTQSASTAALASVVMPMLASVAKEMPDDEGWTFEPKYDGIRVLAFVAPGAARLITRNAKDKTKQFPEVIAELKKMIGRSKKPLVLDGEIVALIDGEPARFQHLQGRMHVENAHSITRLAKEQPAVFIAFDLLLDGDDALVNESWDVRRARLEKRFGKKSLEHVWMTESVSDGEKMLRRAAEQGWEGIIAKEVDAKYQPGKRSASWLKLKLEKRQEFVVGGYTEPRKSRKHIGALLLGYYNNDDEFIYVGHTGGGFSDKGLQDMYKLLEPLERKTSPFTTTPKTNEKAHWVKPQIVVEVRYNEMTNVGKLRQPIFLGVRDDKNPKDVRLER